MRRRPVLWVAVILFALFVCAGVLRAAALLGLATLPLTPGRLIVLTAVLALFSLTHAWYSLGGRLTTVFFALSAAMSWTYEQVSVMFGLSGAYHYTDYLGNKLGEVPLIIPLAWFMMIYPSYVIANLAIEGRPIGTPGGAWRLVRLAAASAVTMTAWDLVIDPILSGPMVKAWAWEAGGPYFGVPIQNYLGWLLTTFTVFLTYRTVEQRWAARGLPDARGATSSAGLATAALPVAAYGLMLVADLLSGVAPTQLAIIGPVVMGVPLAGAAWRLLASPHLCAPTRTVAAGQLLQDQ